jgi:predicted phosphatase
MALPLIKVSQTIHAIAMRPSPAEFAILGSERIALKFRRKHGVALGAILYFTLRRIHSLSASLRRGRKF